MLMWPISTKEFAGPSNELDRNSSYQSTVARSLSHDKYKHTSNSYRQECKWRLFAKQSVEGPQL